MSTESDAAYDSAGEHSRQQRQIQEQQQLDPSVHLPDATAGGDGQNLNPPTLRRVTLKFKPSPVTTSTTLTEDQPPLSPTPNLNGHSDDAMVTATRRSTRSSNNVQASGSEYGEDGNGSAANSGHSSASPEESRSRRTRSNVNQRHNKFDYDDDDDDEFEDLRSKQQPVMTTITSSRGRTIKLRNTNAMVESDEEDEHPIRPAGGGARRLTRGQSQSNRRNSFIDDDGADQDDFEDDDKGFGKRKGSRKPSEGGVKTEGGEPLDGDAPQPRTRSSKASRRSAKRRSARDREEEGDYVDDGTLSSIDMDADGSVDHDDPVPSTPEEPPRRSATPEENGGYGLRKRTTKVNYAIPPPLAPEEIGPNVNGPSSGGVDNIFTNGFGRNGVRGTPKAFRKVIPWGIGNRFGPGAADGAGAFGRGPARRADDSDSDVPNQTPRRPFGAAAGGGPSGLYPAGGMGPNELAAAAAGTPSNLGKVGTDSALADADPLGVNQNVTFDQVGGLDGHISQLKEMVTLPLLYPEVFQRFNLTPPRGVLFHGPPGTGKTLLARALAASSRSGGRSITFYMRKGADCLSKWVGEAERQLRLLFEEARTNQPSIIFFDEIDGLAPVRSSKQDQIHASIVSTLLALMDGMDGRGQVIVIGATNRPDAIDPALRRPGRFDREFYFPLPDLSARHRILSINTNGWDGWEGEKGEDTRTMLAKATKGYGGADLRALCTEAALNAVQRRYPQIYKSADRLLLKPESIQVQARDFMVALKKMIPSSARSTASEAKPLPAQLVPLLSEPLEQVKVALDKALPKSSTRTVLEEAEFEDEAEGGLEREMMLQAMESLRVHRPRIAICGAQGMGQTYIGAAALHHLEGIQVQSLDLGTLMGDSTRTVESAIVQLFVEAKRHKPSIVYIPALLSWCGAVSETARTTVRTMLDSLAPTDPLLLLAIVEGEFTQLPKDVRAWFGHNRENRVTLTRSARESRVAFFKELLEHVHRPPNHFPDGVPRKKRVLEELPVAPPLPPRQPTAAEVAAQAENDERIKAMLTSRLGPVLQDLKRKFKRFSKSARMEYDLDDDPPENPDWPTMMEVPVEPPKQPVQEAPVVADVDGDTNMENGNATPAPAPAPAPEPASEPAPAPVPVPAPAPTLQVPAPIPRHRQFFDMDLEKMHAKLYYSGYLTPKEFLEDISKIVANAEVEPIDNERLFKAQAMYSLTNATILYWEPQFAVECERMAERENQRRKEYEKRRQEKARALQIANVHREGSPTDGLLGPGTRRSARANGQQPEMPFTPDPERKLKRTRSQGGSGDAQMDSPQGRSPKRARTASEEGDHNEAAPEIQASLQDGQAGQATQSGEHPQVRSVRFANELGMAEHDAVSLLNGLNGVPETPEIPAVFPNIVVPGPDIDGPLPSLETVPIQFQASPLLPTPGLLQEPTPGLMGTNASGSAVSLLHVPSPQGGSAGSTPTTPQQTLPTDPPAPTASPRRSEEPDSMMVDVAPPVARTPTPPPPLPDFVVDEELAEKLNKKLVDETSTFNVEQLEQLRATCLSTIWKHRSSWNRDDMIKEMLQTADEFIAEIAMDDEDSPSP